MTPSDQLSGDSQQRCIIKHVAHFGLFVEIPDLSAKGLLRITEMSDPSLLERPPSDLIGTAIFARIIGKEKADGPFILCQR